MSASQDFVPVVSEDDTPTGEPSAAWTPVGFILEYDTFEPGDIGIILNGPVGYGYGISDIRKFAAASDMYAALTELRDWLRYDVPVGTPAAALRMMTVLAALDKANGAA